MRTPFDSETSGILLNISMQDIMVIFLFFILPVILLVAACMLPTKIVCRWKNHKHHRVRVIEKYDTVTKVVCLNCNTTFLKKYDEDKELVYHFWD